MYFDFLAGPCTISGVQRGSVGNAPNSLLTNHMWNCRELPREQDQPKRGSVLAAGGGLLLAALIVLGASGCHTTSTPSFEDVQVKQAAAHSSSNSPSSLVLHEGDKVTITFPGAPTLNTVQVIRRDGRITLSLVGEVEAAGKTPAQLEQELVKLYGPQLQTKEVNVAAESSLAVYVTGAVLRPGRITSDRPITALQAIMEAGVDYTKANLKSVRVIRNEDGKTEHHVLNLKRVLQGTAGDQFMLKPADIVYVPERFSWF